MRHVIESLRVDMPQSKAERIAELHFSPSTIIRLLALIAAVMALGALYTPALLVSMALISIYSLLSTKNAIKSLAFIYLIRASNPAFTGDDLNLAYPSILAVLFCCTRIYYDYFKYKVALSRPLIYLTLYVAVAVVLSALASTFITISLFKLLYFYYVAAAILIGFSVLSKTRIDISSWIASFYASVAILSFPLIFHDYGYYRDSEGFQGILNHPQEYAIFMAPFAAMLVVKALSTKDGIRSSAPWLIYVLYTLVLTHARTSFLALILGIIAGYYFFGRKMTWPTTIRLVAVSSSIVILVGVVVYLAPAVNQFLLSFVFKGTDGDFSEAFVASRGFLITESVGNFLAHPFTGIGFGVNLSELRPSQPVYEPLTGLPISFPTEKANLIIAVLEECGIIGFVFFLMFVYHYFKSIRADGKIVISVLGFTALFTNIGEMTFFSMNSYGLFLWLLLGLTTYKYGKN